MLAVRFRTLQGHLGRALHALVERGRLASAAVLAVGEAVKRRSERMFVLMERFSAGELRARVAGPRRTVVARGAEAARPAPVATAKLWPEHVPDWFYLLGHNSPSHDVRMRWDRGLPGPGLGGPEWRHVGEFDRAFRALVAEDAEMRGLLGVSREARRLARWFLRLGSTAALPAEVREPRRVRKPKPRKERAVACRPARPHGPWTPPKPSHPFMEPPANLLREEREARGLPVPPARREYNPALQPYFPAELELRRQWNFKL